MEKSLKVKCVPSIVTTGEVASIKASQVQHFDLCLLSLPVSYVSLPFHLENEENPMKPDSFMWKEGQKHLEIFILPGKRTREFHI